MILTPGAVRLDTLEKIWRGSDPIELDRAAKPAVETVAGRIPLPRSMMLIEPSGFGRISGSFPSGSADSPSLATSSFAPSGVKAI